MWMNNKINNSFFSSSHIGIFLKTFTPPKLVHLNTYGKSRCFGFVNVDVVMLSSIFCMTT